MTKIEKQLGLSDKDFKSWRKTGRCHEQKFRRELALQVDLATVHVSALPRPWWPKSGRKQGQAEVELKKGRMSSP